MLYVGPDVILPLVSALAAIGGVILMFWRRTVALMQALSRGLNRLLRRSSDSAS